MVAGYAFVKFLSLVMKMGIRLAFVKKNDKIGTSLPKYVGAVQAGNRKAVAGGFIILIRRRAPCTRSATHESIAGMARSYVLCGCQATGVTLKLHKKDSEVG